jgi:mannose-6-phosphate isomerase-like protein (cupin superfamily)
MLYSMGIPTSIRLMKLGGPSDWKTHNYSDEIFIVLNGELNIYYRSAIEKGVRLEKGEMICVPMKMEFCVFASEGTDVLLIQGREG